MAPKTRSGKVVGTVVTKRVVKETVEVVVSPGEKENGENEGERMEVVSESIKENEKVEVISSPSRRPVKVVFVGGEGEEEDQQPRQEQTGDKSPVQEEHEQQRSQENEPLEHQDEYLQDHEHGQQQEKDQEHAEQQPDQAKEQRQEEDEETQLASQPEVIPAPTPPKYESQPRKEEEENSKKREKKDEKVAKESHKKNTTLKGGVEGSGKRRKKRAKVGGGGSQEYKRYVFRVMKQVHPDMGISSKAMTILDNLMSDMFERIADEASKLSKYVGRATLSSLEIQDAVKLVLPGDLGKHAIAEGSKAVTNYVANVTGDSKFKTKSKS